MVFYPDTVIEWQDGVFNRVEPLAGREAPPGAKRQAGVAIPGLIDAHIHLALDGTPDVVSSLQRMPEHQVKNLIRETARTYLEAGITSVRDLGSPGGVVGQLVDEGSLPLPDSPRIYPAQAISTPTGHGNFIARHAETFSEYRNIIDSLKPSIHPFLKVFASGGVITSGSDPAGLQMSLDLLRQVTDYAHDKGFRVAAHAHSHTSIANCVAAGVDTIEHFSYLDQSLAETVAGSSSHLVSTYVATHRFANHPEKFGAEPEAVEKIILHDTVEAAALRLAATIPGNVIAGSDSGTILNPHPRALHEAGNLMVQSGFSDHEALVSMTSRSALALGIDAGQIEVGKPADAVILAEDPTSSIAALGSITQVIIGGITLSK